MYICHVTCRLKRHSVTLSTYSDVVCGMALERDDRVVFCVTDVHGNVDVWLTEGAQEFVDMLESFMKATRHCR